MSLSSLNHNHVLTAAKAPRLRHLRKPRPLRSAQVPESSETEDSSKMLKRHVGTNDLVEQEMITDFNLNNNLSHFGYIITTLRIGEGEDLILTGQSLKTILSAYGILCKGLDATLIRMESVPYEGATTDQISTSPPEYNSMFTNHESEEMQKEDIPLICYSKQELLQYSLSKLSKVSPPNWNVLIHIHPICCLPANQVTTYFDPSQFHPHDGSFVAMYRRN